MSESYNLMLIEKYRRKIIGEFEVQINDGNGYRKATISDIENIIFRDYGHLDNSDSWIRFYKDFRINNE